MKEPLSHQRGQGSDILITTSSVRAAHVRTGFVFYIGMVKPSVGLGKITIHGLKGAARS